jgi:hypothetical protein
MRRRYQARRQADDAVLEGLRQKPVARSAHEVAIELGWPWRVVAQALKRLVAAGEVLTQVHEYRDSCSRPRATVRYRAPSATAPALPAWLAGEVLPIRAARLVVGRASLG